jgi:hypothetical protein
MGILDDAIREHLELKRSHGAPDEEIRRKEAEVFGSSRPDAATAGAPSDEHTRLLTHEGATDLEPLQPAPDDPYAVHPGDALEPDLDAGAESHVAEPARPDVDSLQPAGSDMSHAAEAGAGMLEPHEVDPGPPSQRHEHDDEQHPALIDHDHIGGEEHPPEPVFRPGTREPPSDPVLDAPTERYDIEEPPPRHSHEHAEGEDEDVLEETPEFLQDAPEHDRLWFEQKPPRDFDFGE